MPVVGHALRIYTPDGEWPRCYYNHDRLCGERETGMLTGYGQRKEGNPSWHVADMCSCPSCPLRCAIRDVVWELKKEA